MKKGYWRTDDSGHDYLIPVELIEEHDSMSEAMAGKEFTDQWCDLIDQYENNFGHYRIDHYELTRAPIIIWEDVDFRRTKDGDLK